MSWDPSNDEPKTLRWKIPTQRKPATPAKPLPKTTQAPSVSEPTVAIPVRLSVASNGDFPLQRANLRKDRIAYTKLLDSIYDAVFLTNSDGIIADLNPRAIDFFKLNPARAAGVNVLDLISGADIALLRQITQHLAEHRFTLLEAQCIRMNGTYFPAEIAVNRIDLSETGQLCFFVRDITVRRQALAKLEDANERLQANDRSRMEFISNVSHELRTPLTSMIYGIRNMLSGITGELAPETRVSVLRLNSDCKRLLATVNDILDLRKIESGTLKLMKSLIPLSRLVKGCVDTLRIQATEKNQKIVDKIQDKGTFAFCDMQKLERVIINVIGNAVKFTPDGGKITVSATPAEEKPGFICFKCDDNGIGIPKDALPHVTERYFRVGEQIAGTGLGLSISQEIVRMHGGCMEILSPVPGSEDGTSVRIYLPMADAPSILIVEDEPEVMDMIAEDISDNGYQVIKAGTAEDAFQTLNTKNVNMIVLDISLPDMDGSQFVISIRGKKETSRIPILVVSGTMPEGQSAEIFHRFRIPMLTKPWKKEDLFSRIGMAFFSTNPSGGA